MSSIQAGDVVVCVDVAARPHAKAPSAEPHLHLRGTYRVTTVRPNNCGLPVIKLAGAAGVWRTWRFRKIEKAADEFIAQIKACRPKRDRVSS